MAILLLLIADMWCAGTFAQNTGGEELLPIRGLYVQFERRGYPNGYYSGDLIQTFNDFDPVVGSTVAAEVELQLNVMRSLGVNTITFELRSSDPTWNPDYVPPECNIGPVLGFQWPNPTATETTNLKAFFDLVHSKGIRIFLRLVNTHMEEQSTANSVAWLGAILGAVGTHPALDLVLFEGNVHLADTDGDGIGDTCTPPAEPPLWSGPASIPAQYVKWAISYGLSLGIPARKLSAEAIVGNYFTDSNPPAGPETTDGHLWKPIFVLKSIFDALQIPSAQRTYALSLYEHRKCVDANQWQGIPCVDTDPHAWADQTLKDVFDIIGRGTGARVVAPEMGVSTPVNPEWQTDKGLESLVQLMKKHGVDGGCLWLWVNIDESDSDPQPARTVKIRGVEFVYNEAVRNTVIRSYKLPVNPSVLISILPLLFDD